MKQILLSILGLLTCSQPGVSQQNQTNINIVKPQAGIPFTKRVNIQSEVAHPDQIIDRQWVVVGTPAPHAFQLDTLHRYEGKPSFRFELTENDNRLAGYNPGETKGRIETSYCYATIHDFEGQHTDQYTQAQRLRTVYHYGKGQCPQGTAWKYRVAIWVPDTLSPQVNTIFAQWHGMPRRNLVQNPQGEIKELSNEAFLQLEEHTWFAKEVGYEKIQCPHPRGKTDFRKGKRNGWLIEQGGYPPLAFGFHDGFFYIKANSDRKWFSDKTDRTNASVARLTNGASVSSDFKTSTLVFKEPIEKFPRNQWVQFDVEVHWSQYDAEKETLLAPGMLDVQMTVQGKTRHIVNHVVLPIGRNDRDGYYFKHGIYRTGSSTVPVAYYLAGYTQTEMK